MQRGRRSEKLSNVKRETGRAVAVAGKAKAEVGGKGKENREP